MFKFGKYKGKRFEDIPLDYLRWAKENSGLLSASDKQKIESILEDESPVVNSSLMAVERQLNETKRQLKNAMDQLGDNHREILRVKDKVRSARIKLALLAHPDHGGSEEMMKKINDIFSEILS